MISSKDTIGRTGVKCGYHMLQLVIKMNIFDEINDALIVDIFKNLLQERAGKVFLADVLKIRTVHKYSMCFTVSGTHRKCVLVGLRQRVSKKS